MKNLSTLIVAGVLLVSGSCALAGPKAILKGKPILPIVIASAAPKAVLKEKTALPIELPPVLRTLV